MDYSAVAVCSFYLCLFGEEGETLGGVDGGGAVWSAGFGDWVYFCYEPLDIRWGFGEIFVERIKDLCIFAVREERIILLYGPSRSSF